MTGKLAGAWLAANMVITPALATVSAYLPVTGPTPLRFEVATTHPFDFSSVGKVVVPPKTEMIPQAVDPAPTNTASPVVSITESNDSVVSVALPATTPEEPLVPASFMSPHPAGNLLVITPEILAEYFRPAPGATNAAGVSVFLPVQVGFTPPADKNPAQSRATYKVQ